MSIIESSTGVQWKIVDIYPKGWALIQDPLVYYTGFHSDNNYDSSLEICFYRDLHPGYKERLTLSRSEEAQYSVKTHINVQSFDFSDWELMGTANVVPKCDISHMFW